MICAVYWLFWSQIGGNELLTWNMIICYLRLPKNIHSYRRLRVVIIFYIRLNVESLNFLNDFMFFFFLKTVQKYFSFSKTNIMLTYIDKHGHLSNLSQSVVSFYFYKICCIPIENKLIQRNLSLSLLKVLKKDLWVYVQFLKLIIFTDLFRKIHTFLSR